MDVSNGAQPNMQQNFRQQFNTRTGPVETPQEPGVGCLVPPRLLAAPNEQLVPEFASRHVSVSHVPSVQISNDAEATRTIEELSDPAQTSRQSMDQHFPKHNGQPRVIASDILHQWAEAVDQNKFAEQKALKELLEKHLGT